MVVEVEEVVVEVIVIVAGTVDILALFSLRLKGLGFHFIRIFAKIDDSEKVVGCCVVVSIVVAIVVAKWLYLFLKRDKRPVLWPVADDFRNTFGFLSSWKVRVSDSSFCEAAVLSRAAVGTTMVDLSDVVDNVVDDVVVDVIDDSVVDDVVDTMVVDDDFPTIFEYRSLSIASMPIFGFDVVNVVDGIVVTISA